MAQKTTVTLIDDLSGDEIINGDGGSMRFALDDTEYEIDLTNANQKILREALSDFIGKARKVSRRTRRPAGRDETGRSDASELAAIRTWANENGYEVSARGRIARSVRDAYAAAH